MMPVIAGGNAGTELVYRAALVLAGTTTAWTLAVKDQAAFRFDDRSRYDGTVYQRLQRLLFLLRVLLDAIR